MKIISLKIPEDLVERLSRIAASRRISRSRLIRDLIEGGLESDEEEAPPSVFDLMQGGLGVVSSGHHDLATDRRHMEGFGK
ncbi:MAG: ribbon-helix-helix protein, CopG family [Rhodothermia bacterium]